MSRLLTYGIIQQKRKVDLGFETYCAIAGFDRTAQPVDIYAVFNAYYKTNADAKYVYSVLDSATTMTLDWGTSYRYGYTSGGIDTIVDVEVTTLLNGAHSGAKTSISVDDTSSFPASGRISFADGAYFIYTSKTATSFVGSYQNIGTQLDNAVVYQSQFAITFPGSTTKKWVLVNHVRTTATTCYMNNNTAAVWLYCGTLTNSVWTAREGIGDQISTVTTIHIHSLNNITNYGRIIANSLTHYNSNLTGDLYLSNSVTTLVDVFESSKKITSITFSDSVTTLAYFCFAGLTALRKVNWGIGLVTIGSSCFKNCTAWDEGLVIPNSVVTILDGAFSGNTKLTSLTLSNSLISIGNTAFNSCYGMLGSLTFPSSLTSIGDAAFSTCYGFTGTLEITSNITSIGQGAFLNTIFNAFDVSANAGYHVHDSVLYEESTHTALHGLKNYSGTLTLESDTIIIGNYCFYYNTARTGAISIPSNVTSIGLGVFQGCSGFNSSITIGNSVITIGSYAFAGCLNATSLNLGTSVVTIDSFAFNNCKAVAGTLTIPNSVITIGVESFDYMWAITALDLGTSVQSIGNYAFSYCILLAGTINIPASVTTFGTEVFDSPASSAPITAITSSSTNYPVSDNVLYDVKTAGQIKAIYGAKAYSGTLTLRADTTHIIGKAFFYNAGRTGTLSLPSSVISIGINAFNTASGFTRVDSYPATAPTVGPGGLTLGGTARPLHIPTGGGTGYGVAPWTTATIFSSITADL